MLSHLDDNNEFVEGRWASDAFECCLCLESFVETDEIRVLPCAHSQARVTRTTAFMSSAVEPGGAARGRPRLRVASVGDRLRRAAESPAGDAGSR